MTVQRWVRTAFGCQVIQGYALTETCAGATLQLEYDYRPGVVGPPVRSSVYLFATVVVGMVGTWSCDQFAVLHWS